MEQQRQIEQLEVEQQIEVEQHESSEEDNCSGLKCVLWNLASCIDPAWIAMFLGL